MEWLNETYTVTAGDVAQSWTGRAWNWETRRWETISGVEMSRGRETKHVLRAFHVTPHAVTTNALLQGVIGRLYIVADPLQTGFKLKLPCNPVQGATSSIRFIGRENFLCGCLWRILAGGLAAGDTVEVTVGYE